MRKLSTLAIMATIAAASGPALADHDGAARAAVEPVAAQTVRHTIEALGYDVQRLRAGERGFKARIVDRDSGGVVEVRFGPDGALLRARLAD
jgi:hypothetical protein